MSRTTIYRRSAPMMIAVLGLLVGCGSNDGAGGDDRGADESANVSPTSVDVATTTESRVPDATATTVVVPAPPADISTSSPPATESPLSLLPDGLGIVSFYDSYTDVLQRLTEVLGEPDYIGNDVFEPAIGIMRRVTWGHLGVDFTGDEASLSFSGYRLAKDTEVEGVDGEYRLTLLDWAPEPWEQQLSTDAGIGIDDTVVDANEAYPTVYAARCNSVVEPTTLVAADETVDQLFVAPEQAGLYLQRPVDGTVWSVGAQAVPNPLLCDGRGE